MAEAHSAAVNDAASLRRIRSVLAAVVLLPLAVTLILCVNRWGQDLRDARAALLAETLERALVQGAAAIDQMPQRGFAVARYDAGRSYARTTATGAIADALPDILPGEFVQRLESLDRTFTARWAGRSVAVSPVKDADQWDLLGAIMIQDAVPQPAAFPPFALGIALITLAFTWLALMVFARSARTAGAILVLLPAAAFGFWLASLSVPGALPGATQPHRTWTIILIAAWFVIASIGMSCARLAARPLAFREAGHAWAFLAPSFLHLLIFSIGPILFSLWLSFHEWNLLQPTRPFVGVQNYAELARDSAFWRAVRNTAVYVLFVPIGMSVALALALLVNRKFPGVRLLRTVFFLPYVTSFVAISLVWRWMFQPDIGLLNRVITQLGMPAQPWLSSPATALPSLMLMSIWMYAGYMMIIFLAGLQSIPASLYESARIDGAGPWQRFLRITIPMLRPTMLFILVTMVIFMFQVFTAVYVMTEGGPLHSTDVVVYHIYRAAWEYLRMGYASAMAWVLFAIIFVITLVQFRTMGGARAQ